MKRLLLIEKTEIRATPEKVFDFLVHMDQHHQFIHPDHVTFRWLNADHLEVGAIGYFEQYLNGKLYQEKARYTRIIPNEWIEFKICNPFFRWFHPRSTFDIRPTDEGSMFTACNEFRLAWIAPHSNYVREILRALQAHMRVEGDGMKRLLEA